MVAKIKRDWWKSAWPKLGDRSPGSRYDQVYKALKDYEHAKRGTSVANIVDALMTVTGVAQKVMKELNAEFRMAVTRKSVEKSLKELCSATDSEMSRLMRDGNKEVKVWSRNFKQAAGKTAKGQALAAVDAGNYGVTLTLPLIVVKELEHYNADTRLFTELNATFDAKLDDIENQLYKAAAPNGGIIPPDIAQILFDNSFEKLKDEIAAVPGAVLKQVSKNKRISRKYKRTKGVKIARSSVTVAISAASFAVPGEQALAIISLVRATADLAKEIVTLCMRLEAKQKILRWEIETLQKSYAEKRKGKEGGKQLVNSLAGTDVMLTTKKLVADFHEFRGATAMVAVRMGRKQAALRKILTESAKLQKDFQEMYDWVDDVSIKGLREGAKKINKAQKALDNMYKNTDKQITHLNKEITRVMRAEKAMPKMKAQVKAIKDGNDASIDAMLETIDETVKVLFYLGSFTDITAGAKAVESYAMLVVSEADRLVDAAKALKKYKTK